MRPRRKPENERDSQHIAGNLRQERTRLHQWICSDVARLAAVREETARVRAQAHGLVDHASRQGVDRQLREEALDVAKKSVHAAFKAPPPPEPAWEYLAFGTNPALTGDGQGRENRGYSSYWDRWVEESADWGEIKGEADNLIAAAHDEYARLQEARSAAEQAVERMDRTVRAALDWSATCFRAGEPAPVRDRRPAKASAMPLAAFLIVALVGIHMSPGPTAGAIAAAFLCVVVAMSVLSIVRDDHRVISVATLTAGSSFASFTAAYLVVRIVHPDDLLRSGAPISSIAEAAFTSLTVGVTGGTIGTDLGGTARIVAFIQILLTVGAVASGVAWAWRRLIERSSDQGTPSPRADPQ
jgi:hypothetical protein